MIYEWWYASLHLNLYITVIFQCNICMINIYTRYCNMTSTARGGILAWSDGLETLTGNFIHLHYTIFTIREAIEKKRIKKCENFLKGGGGLGQFHTFLKGCFLVLHLHFWSFWTIFDCKITKYILQGEGS